VHSGTQYFSLEILYLWGLSSLRSQSSSSSDNSKEVWSLSIVHTASAALACPGEISRVATHSNMLISLGVVSCVPPYTYRETCFSLFQRDVSPSASAASSPPPSPRKPPLAFRSPSPQPSCPSPPLTKIDWTLELEKHKNGKSGVWASFHQMVGVCGDQGNMWRRASRRRRCRRYGVVVLASLRRLPRPQPQLAMRTIASGVRILLRDVRDDPSSQILAVRASNFPSRPGTADCSSYFITSGKLPVNI
jgi:hypothetical protein